MDGERDDFYVIEKELVPKILEMIESAGITAATAPYVADYLRSRIESNNKKAFEEYLFKVQKEAS